MDLSINIPRGTLDAYMADETWGKFWEINEVDFDNAATVTISDYGYATFASIHALDFSNFASLTAYTAKLYGNSLALTEVTSVPANTGIILQGTPGKTYTIPYAETADATVTSDLKAMTADTEVDPAKANYVLANVDDEPGFYRYTGTAITAGHAYLELDAAVSAAKGITLDFGQTTGIIGVGSATHTDGDYYTLSGQRVTNPTKGLYIKNGKKVVIK